MACLSFSCVAFPFGFALHHGYFWFVCTRVWLCHLAVLIITAILICLYSCVAMPFGCAHHHGYFCFILVCGSSIWICSPSRLVICTHVWLASSSSWLMLYSCVARKLINMAPYSQSFSCVCTRLNRGFCLWHFQLRVALNLRKKNFEIEL